MYPVENYCFPIAINKFHGQSSETFVA